MPDFYSSPMPRAATLAQLDRVDEAKVAANDLLKPNGNYEQEGLDLVNF
ncbi:hypothetical protein ACSSV1_004636 [Labrenzia sp. MBR-25]